MTQGKIKNDLLIFSDGQMTQNDYISVGDEDEPEEPPMTDIMFTPDDTNNLEPMFQAMSICQALHPDPQDSFSDGKLIE